MNTVIAEMGSAAKASVGDVLAMIVSTREDEPVLAAAAQLATAHAATVSALLFDKAPEPSEAGAVYAGLWVLAPEAPRSTSKDEMSALARRLREAPGRVSVKRIQVAIGADIDRAGLEARRADITIMLQPRGGRDAAFRRAMFESVLYESGRPVLLVPPGWRGAVLGKTILIAWDGSREATRAVADAQRMLTGAERVLVFEVNVGPGAGLPAAELVARLRRLGLQCHYRSVLGSRAEVDSLLLREAEAISADLIVMGGYGHARLQELLFGGVTRSMIRTSSVPTFISR